MELYLPISLFIMSFLMIIISIQSLVIRRNFEEINKQTSIITELQLSYKEALVELNLI